MIPNPQPISYPNSNLDIIDLYRQKVSKSHQICFLIHDLVVMPCCGPDLPVPTALDSLNSYFRVILSIILVLRLRIWTWSFSQYLDPDIVASNPEPALASIYKNLPRRRKSSLKLNIIIPIKSIKSDNFQKIYWVAFLPCCSRIRIRSRFQEVRSESGPTCMGLLTMYGIILTQCW